jgi:hypothetical protein
MIDFEGLSTERNRHHRDGLPENIRYGSWEKPNITLQDDTVVSF